MPDDRTVLPNPRQTPRFAGISTFARYPRLEDVANANRPVDWAIYGVPYDSGVTYRPGTRFGPRAVRTESQYVKRYHVEHELDVCEILSLADAGDSPVEPYDCERNTLAVTDFARTLGDATHTKLFAVGGDHSIAYANIRATWERRGKPEGGLAMVHFDSHLDTVDTTLNERWSHASPFIRLVEDGCLNPNKMVSIGIKGPLNTRHDLDYAASNGVTIITAEQVRREGCARLDRFLDGLGDTPAYVTFDIDAIDPSLAVGTGTPSVGGLTPAEAFALLRRLRGLDVIGGDVVEVLPDRDVGGNAALLAGHIMFEILCLDAAYRLDAAITRDGA